LKVFIYFFFVKDECRLFVQLRNMHFRCTLD
jgi:hypothetical protein